MLKHFASWSTRQGLLLVCLLSPWAFAQEQKLNVRELCRIEVSGLSMSLWNDVSLAKQQGEVASMHLAELRNRLATLDKDYKSLEKQGMEAIPAFDVDSQVVGLRFAIKQVQTQIAEEDEVRLSSAKSLDELIALQKVFSEAIKGVFMLRTLPVPNGKPGEVFQHVEYQKDCREYDLLCPLSEAQAAELQRIVEKLPLIAKKIERATDLKPCGRYSMVRRPVP